MWTSILIILVVFISYLFLRRKKEKTDPVDPPLEEGYFRPPSRCKSALQTSGAIIRFRTYFKDVLLDDWFSHCKLEPTYTKVLLMNGGNEKLLGIFEGPYWS